MVQKMGLKCVNPSTKAWFLGVVYLNGGWNFNRCALVIVCFFSRKRDGHQFINPLDYLYPLRKMLHTFDHGTYNANSGLVSNLVVYVGSAMSVAYDISFLG